MVCVLCLEAISKHCTIDIFSDEGLKLNVSNTIGKHFWFQPKSVREESQRICRGCWTTLEDFHNFYEKVAEAHRSHEMNKLNQLSADLLPCHNAGYMRDKSNDFAETAMEIEVKVELEDLESLPQVEIFENCERPARSSHESQRTIEEDPVANSHSYAEETNALEDVRASNAPDARALKHSILDRTMEPVGQEPDGKACVPSSTAESNGSTDSNVKEERSSLSPLVIDEQPLESEKDTSLSSTEVDDSDDSDYDPEPQRYAEIPVRKVVKPKKYKKRVKPLIPPKRMSREEIERRNAQQAEYDKIIGEFFEKFPCPKCDLLVRNFTEVLQHFRISHGEDKGYMLCCGKKFNTRKKLVEHIFLHNNPEHFRCKTCDKTLQDSKSLELHELSHTNPDLLRTFQCDKCPKTYTTKAALKHHEITAHVPKEEYKFPCSLCDKKLPTKVKYNEHMKSMHDPKSSVMCDQCGVTIKGRYSLKKHHKLKHPDKPRDQPEPVQCTICGKWLLHEKGLRQHMKGIHEDSQGEHRCHLCEHVSPNTRALRRHIYFKHECERKHKCTMCEKAFKRKQDLREHTSTHTGEVLYRCPYCPITFFCNANMYKHQQRLHPVEYEAGRKNRTPNNLRQRQANS